ncbi:ankyrin repeat-containing domain protein [Cladorrhinum sp. PSN332]|nr:ankyrin repeat-containing domain protein [Cladorrhinum sp. PSN332]
MSVESSPQNSRKRSFSYAESDDEGNGQGPSAKKGAFGETAKDPYHNLPLPRNSIRLLQLLPHPDQHAPIECRLTILPLDSEGTRPYEALSYAWGTEDDPKTILVNGRHQLAIGQSLHAALVHLRDYSLERHLWIDAICINQSRQPEALEERSRQVQSMARIYAQATRVVVWLGEAAGDSDQALDRIQAAAESPAQPSFQETAIFALLRRSWFQRVWVLQEVAAARHILLKCGQLEVDGYAFCLGLSALNHLSLSATTYAAAFLMRGSIFRSRRVNIASTVDQPQGRRFSLNIRPLSELIDMYHTREATDLRDKVYALLGMCTDNLSETEISANYQIPWQQVFRQLICHIIPPQALMSLETWPNKQVAVMKCRGYFLGEIFSVKRDTTWQDKQHVVITWGDYNKSSCTFQISAKAVHAGDVVYLLQGTSKPTIIRRQHSHWVVIMIAVSVTNLEMPAEDRLRSECPLLWSWDALEQDRPADEGVEDDGFFIHNTQQVSKGPVTQLTVCFDKVRRLETFRLGLHDTKKYDEDLECLQTIVGLFDNAIRSLQGEPASEVKQLKSLVDSFAKNDGPWTVLCLAAANGHFSLFKFLLETLGVESHEELITMMWLAGQNNHAATVQVKLESDNTLLVNSLEVQFDAQCQQKALELAIISGNWVVAKLLLGSSQFDPNAGRAERSKEGGTPLHWAVSRGQLAMIRLLLSHDEINATLEDVDGGTTIHCATQEGHTEAVRILLADGRVDPSAKDDRGKAALHLASELGRTPIVELLLASGRVDPDAYMDFRNCWSDEHMATKRALHDAASQGYEEIVKLLLDTGNVEINNKERDNVPPALRSAAEKGHTGVVQLLLDTGKVDRDDLKSALEFAKRTGHEAVVDLLLSRGEVYASPGSMTNDKR